MLKRRPSLLGHQSGEGDMLVLTNVTQLYHFHQQPSTVNGNPQVIYHGKTKVLPAFRSLLGYKALLKRKP
jgi:hypothetical protein